MRWTFCSLSPVPGGEGWGEGALAGNVRPPCTSPAASPPLTLTLSPGYGGEGINARHYTRCMARTPTSADASFRPTKAQLLAANDRTIADVIAPNLRVLFCGINPGLWSGATGHHFARPGNRFWPALYAGGFTDRLLKPHEKAELLHNGIGITNVVMRTTAAAAELEPKEFVAGGKALRRKVLKYRPRVLAVLGIGAFRAAFDHPAAHLGEQPDRIGETRVWILPNPSGLNAHYTPVMLGKLFAELRTAVERG